MSVIDSSAIIELVLNPAKTTEWAHLIRGEIFAPELFIPESLNALKKQMTRKIITRDRAALAMRRIQSFPINLVSMQGITQDIWESSRTFSTYDACYVVLARKLNVPLVTCDIKLAREARKVITVITLE